MNLYSPIHYIFGEYVFETDPKSFSRLANQLSKKRINFWGNEFADGFVRIHISVFAAEEAVDTAKEMGVPLQLVKKRGIPFIFSRYRKRYGLFVGLVLGLFLIFWSQLFVWKIEITGNTSVTSAEIRKSLSECGISVGSFIPMLDPHRDANVLLLNCRELSSAAISINGTHLKVSVLERTPLPDIMDTSGYYNVVASRDGVILDIDAALGTPEVSEGDVVFEGELLINSFTVRANGTYFPTHAQGIIYAAVKESFVTEIPLQRTTKCYTGRSETKKIYTVLGKTLNFWTNDSSPYEYFDGVSSEYDLELFGFIQLPVSVFRITYSEYVPEVRTIDEAYAEKLARSELDDYLRGFKCEILSCESEFSKDEEKGVCKLVANAVLKENIAKEVPFEIENHIMFEILPKARE